jgi:hypothetical protein
LELTAHVDEGLQLRLRGREEIGEGGGVSRLATVHVVHVSVKGRIDEITKRIGIGAVTLEILGLLLAGLKSLLRLARKTLRRGLATVVESDIMTTIIQLCDRRAV